MATRYRPHSSFSVDVKGIPRTFVPNYIDPVTGLQGYDAAALKGLTKDQRASFEEIGADFDEPVVEQATAAPGEKRSTTTKPKRATSTKK